MSFHSICKVYKKLRRGILQEIVAYSFGYRSNGSMHGVKRLLKRWVNQGGDISSLGELKFSRDLHQARDLVGVESPCQVSRFTLQTPLYRRDIYHGVISPDPLSSHDPSHHHLPYSTIKPLTVAYSGHGLRRGGGGAFKLGVVPTKRC